MRLRPPNHPGRRRPPTLALLGLFAAAAGVLLPLVAPAGAAWGDTGNSTHRPAAGARLTATQSIPSYWLVANDGGVFAFGGLPFYGSMGGHPLNAPIVGMAPTPDGKGYWLDAADGGIFSFGDAAFHGSMGGHPLNQPMVGTAVDPATGGYWEVASDGGIFAFSAGFYGSMGGHPLNAPIVGMAATADGRGYWLVAADGGMFAFGDAAFHGSMGGHPLNKPIVSMGATADGGGYWLVATDGGMFSFGDANFEGSLGSDPLTYPVAAMASTGDAGNDGYWMTNANGAVSAFGTAGNYGNAPQHLAQPIVGIAVGPGNGASVNGAYPSGSFGFDVSNFQCSSTLPSGHTVGIVEVTGWANSAPNPCLSQEAAWAGGGLNLYVFLSYGTSTTNEPGCNGDQACNWGFQAASYAYDYAKGQGVNVSVGWWLDVERANWSGDLAENAQVVAGALIELQGLGLNQVGIYASPDVYNSIVGNYTPAVPVWLAWYGTAGPQYNCANGYSYTASKNEHLPTGGIWLTQYDSNTFDDDYAC